MNVRVIYPSHGCADVKKRIEINLLLDAKDDQEALALAWRATNCVDKKDVERMRDYASQNGVGGIGIRSAMVGDVALVEGERWYICEMVGWRQVTKEIADVWIGRDFHERMMGYDYHGI